VVPLLLACETPPAEPAPASPILPPTPAALLQAGACRDDGRVDGIEPRSVPGGRLLWEVLCRYAAYQGAYEYWWSDDRGLRPALVLRGSPWTLVGNPELDAAATLTWLSKARGPGDCGDWYRAHLDGERFVVDDHRSRECPDALDEEPPAPSDWPPAPCAIEDEPALRCTSDGGKELVICASPGRLQYRFGPPGAPSLVFPAEPARDAFTVGASGLAFENGGYRYEVDGGGVRVTKDGAPVTAVRCASPVEVDWSSLGR
jgi:hypothetical protein